MAEVQIALKDEASARKWLSEVQLINEDYHQAMKEAGDTLADMNEFADGTMVDEFTNLGHTILNAADATFQAIDAIADTVNNVLSAASNFVGEAMGVIGKVASLFG